MNAFPQLDMVVLNTHRRLFADVRLRQAVNFAIDRTALAALGDPWSPIPGRTTDQYLAPVMPGFRDVDVYPSHPDLARARRLAADRTGTAVMYTCDQPPCDRIAQIVRTDLARIGIDVVVRTFGMAELFTRMGRPGEPFDLGWAGWVADYPDPDDTLDVLLASGAVPPFDDPVWRARLARAGRLSGPERYLAYGRLDGELARDAAPPRVRPARRRALARDAAPWVAYANRPSVAFLSSRMGCRVYQPVYGIDLAALCVRHSG